MFKLIKKSLYVITAMSLVAQSGAQAMGSGGRATQAAKLALRQAKMAKQEQYLINPSIKRAAATPAPVIKTVATPVIEAQLPSMANSAKLSPTAKMFADFTVTAIESTTAAKQAMTSKAAQVYQNAINNPAIQGVIAETKQLPVRLARIQETAMATKQSVNSVCQNAIKHPTVQGLMLEAKQVPAKLARIQTSAKEYATEFSKNSSDNFWQATAVIGGSTCLAAAIYLYNKTQEANQSQQIIAAPNLPVTEVIYANANQIAAPTVCPFAELIGYTDQVYKTAKQLPGHDDMKDAAHKLFIAAKNAQTAEQLTELQIQADLLADQVAQIANELQDGIVVGTNLNQQIVFSPNTLKDRANRYVVNPITGLYHGATKENAKWAAEKAWNGAKWTGENLAYYTGLSKAYSKLPSKQSLKLGRPVPTNAEITGNNSKNSPQSLIARMVVKPA